MRHTSRHLASDSSDVVPLVMNFAFSCELSLLNRPLAESVSVGHLTANSAHERTWAELQLALTGDLRN